MSNFKPEFAVAADDSADRVRQLLFDHATHGQDRTAEVLQILVEAFGNVVGDVAGFHNSLPIRCGANVTVS